MPSNINLFSNFRNGELADSDTFDADTLSKLRGLGTMLQDTGLTNIVKVSVINICIFIFGQNIKIKTTFLLRT